MKKIIFLIAMIGANAVIGQNLAIQGPDEVCPGQEYTFTASTSYSGSFVWYVYEDGVWTNHPPVSCGQGLKTSSYTHTFSTTEGDAKVAVDFKGGACLQTHTKYRDVKITVKPPGAPHLADWSLSFCPGETRTVAIDPLENNEDDCHFHFTWEWVASSGLTMNHGGNFYSGGTSVQLTVPNNAMAGYSGGYSLRVQSESADPYSSSRWTERNIWIGKPNFGSGEITGPSTLYVGSSGLYTSPSAEGQAYYQWTFPSGGFSVISGQGTPTARLQPTGSTGLKVVELRAYNYCGYTYKYIYINVKSSSSGGGGGGGSDPCANILVMSPNPISGNNVEAFVLPPGGGGPDPCLEALTLSEQDETFANSNSFSMQNIDREGVLVITDHNGEVVYEKQHRGRKINIRFHKLDPGIYTLGYLLNGEEWLTTKFIKQ